MGINYNSKLSRNETLIASTVGNDVVMMNLEREKYYALNETGTFIWHLLAVPLSIAEILTSVNEEFQGSGPDIKTDVECFIAELISEKILIEK